MKDTLILIGVRAFRTFLQGLVMFAPGIAIAASGAVSDELPKLLPHDLFAQLWLAVQLSLAPTIGSLVHNSLEAVVKYEGTLKG